jgi:hypothetical protein
VISLILAVPSIVLGYAALRGVQAAVGVLARTLAEDRARTIAACEEQAEANLNEACTATAEQVAALYEARFKRLGL